MTENNSPWKTTSQGKQLPRENNMLVNTNQYVLKEQQNKRKTTNENKLHKQIEHVIYFHTNQYIIKEK